jgi:hypothetical protein
MGSQIPGVRSPWRLHFLRWRLILVSCHLSVIYSFEMSDRFLEDLCASALATVTYTATNSAQNKEGKQVDKCLQQCPSRTGIGIRTLRAQYLTGICGKSATVPWIVCTAHRNRS